MAQEKKVVDTDALSKMISESGILNPNVKIADLMETTLKAARIAGTGERPLASGDFFISRTYVYFHGPNPS